jgi:hypothetical protein
MKLWVSFYEYDEDTYDILQKTITIEPECGELNYIGGGEYLFTAPDTLTVDSIVITIDYENYSQACGEAVPGTEMLNEQAGCLNCFPYGAPALNKHYGSEELTIKWDSLYVEVNPSELFPGDTADVIIKKRLFDGTLTDFDTSQTFEAVMLEGCILGNLLVDDSLDAYFYDVSGPIKFVADTSADSTGLVLLRIGLIEQTLLSKINNSDEADAFDCMPGPPQTTSYAIVQANINEEPTILLGETKYYQAKYIGPLLDKLIIEEVPGPELNGGLEIDVWGSEPLTIVEGDKLGVYWEKEKPIFGTSNELPTGLIRIVGRFWRGNQTYKVRLAASYGPDEPSIEITVMKPSQLYSENYSGSRLDKARDVFNVQFNVDSLCIYYGGLYGIPPQFIKGQMTTESAKKTFTFDDQTSGLGFAPSYRYEPYTTQFGYAHLYTNNPFVVSSGSMGQNGAAGVPTETEHMHVLSSHYIETPTKIWAFVDARSQFTNPNNLGTFGTRVTDPPEKAGQMTTVYKTINDLYRIKQRELENRLKIFYKVEVLNLTQQQEANETARDEFVSFLKDDWNGNIDGGTKGLDNIYAQTRIAASYGLLQILYPTAINTGTGVNFPVTNNDRPEDLNVITTGMLYMFNHQFYLFNRYNGFPITDNNNWDTEYTTEDAAHFPQPNSGFEESLRVMYHRWNPLLTDGNNNRIYALKVFNNSNNYLPR